MHFQVVMWINETLQSKAMLSSLATSPLEEADREKAREDFSRAGFEEGCPVTEMQ